MHVPERDVVFLVGKGDNPLTVVLWHWEEVLQYILHLREYKVEC